MIHQNADPPRRAASAKSRKLHWGGHLHHKQQPDHAIHQTPTRHAGPLVPTAKCTKLSSRWQLPPEATNQTSDVSDCPTTRPHGPLPAQYRTASDCQQSLSKFFPKGPARTSQKKTSVKRQACTLWWTNLCRLAPTQHPWLCNLAPTLAVTRVRLCLRPCTSGVTSGPMGAQQCQEPTKALCT